VRSTVLPQRTLQVRLLETEAFKGELRIADEALRNQVLKVTQHAYRRARINPANLEYYPFDTYVLAGAFVNPYLPDEFKPVVTVALKRADNLKMLDKRLEVDPLKLVASPPLDLVYPVAVAARAAVGKGVRGVYPAMRPAMLELAWKLGFQAQAGLNATVNGIPDMLRALGYQIVPLSEDNLDRVIFEGEQVVNWLPRERFRQAARKLAWQTRHNQVLPFVWHRETQQKLQLLPSNPFI
jgi:hypothetical protein